MPDGDFRLARICWLEEKSIARIGSGNFMQVNEETRYL